MLRPTGIVDPRITIRPRAAQVRAPPCHTPPASRLNKTCVLAPELLVLAAQLDELIVEASARARRNERTLATVLTRTGAERLAETLRAHGIAAEHMHSGTKSLERVRVLQRLRSGEISALVGVNLLREGLDLPEVSLVAVLDADKEGFLRSTTSLVRTISRAAPTHIPPLTPNPTPTPTPTQPRCRPSGAQRGTWTGMPSSLPT